MATVHKPSAAPLVPDDERLLTTRDVLARIPISRATLGNLIRAKRFPAPIPLTPSKLLWRASTITAWLEDRERHPYKRREFRYKARGVARGR